MNPEYYPWIFRAFFIIVFFRDELVFEGKRRVVRSFAGMAALFVPYLAVFPVSAAAVLSHEARVLNIIVFLLLSSRNKLKRSVYFSMIYLCVSLSLDSLSRNLQIIFFMFGGIVIADIIRFVLIVLIMHFISSKMNLKKIGQIDAARFIPLIFIIAFLEFMERFAYKKISLGSIWLNLLMLLFVSVIVIAAIIIHDNYLISLQEKAQLELLEENSKLQYDALKTQLESAESFRQLAHDMKNHLAVLSSGAAENEAIKTLTEELDQYTESPDTGNDTLDRLICIKMPQLGNLNARLVVSMDISPLSYLTALDISSIFGNLFDNALEALSKQEKGEKYVMLRSRKVGENIVISMLNSCAPSDNQELSTDKEDSLRHGIGLKSIRYTVEKYGGSFVAEYSQPDVFSAVIMLQVKEESNEKEIH